MMIMTTKPLWKQFAEMTPEQVDTEKAAEIERLEKGEMADAELEERIAAWDRAAEWETEQAETLQKLMRLARATGCPKDTPPVTWLIERGLLIKTGGGYAFTPKANGLRGVEAKERAK